MSFDYLVSFFSTIFADFIGYIFLYRGVPIGAVKQACVRNRMDPTILELDPEKSLKSLREGIDKGDQEYAKYWKMLKV